MLSLCSASCKIIFFIDIFFIIINIKIFFLFFYSNNFLFIFFLGILAFQTQNNNNKVKNNLYIINSIENKFAYMKVSVMSIV